MIIEEFRTEQDDVYLYIKRYNYVEITNDWEATKVSTVFLEREALPSFICIEKNIFRKNNSKMKIPIDEITYFTIWSTSEKLLKVCLQKLISGEDFTNNTIKEEYPELCV